MKDLELFVENSNGISSTIQKASHTEIQKARSRKADLEHIRSQIKELQMRQEALEKNCDHKVIYDDSGWFYDSRYCYGCGKSMGLI
jgi:hypothetical protein